MTTYTAAEMIAAAKAYIAADSERMQGRPTVVPRSAWRAMHPVRLPYSWSVVDMAHKNQPSCTLEVDLAGNPYDLWVWDATGKVVEHIDLHADDADQRLARYRAAAS